jgi:hypothetical protein
MQLLRTLMFEARVIAGVELRAPVVQMQNMRRHAVEELAVVRDHQQHAGILQQPLLEPEHRIEIEMVGRLVEQQQIRRHHQRAREIQAHAPAAGEIRNRLAMRLRLETEPVQQPAGACFRVVAVDVGHLLVRDGNRVPILGRHRGGFGFDDRVNPGVAGDDEIDRGIRQRRRFLRDACDAQARRQIEIALVGLDLALDRREQARLAAAVAADHTDARAVVQREVDIGQQQAFAAPQGEIPEGNHGSTGLAGRVL